MHLTYLYQSSRNANARKQITIHAVKAVGLQASFVNNTIANWKRNQCIQYTSSGDLEKCHIRFCSTLYQFLEY